LTSVGNLCKFLEKSPDREYKRDLKRTKDERMIGKYVDVMKDTP